MCLFSGKSQTGLDIPLNHDFVEKGELIILLYLLLTCIFRHFILCDSGICVFSYWWVQRVSGVQSRRQTFVLQHQGAHRQQSLLQQSAERLRQQVSEHSSVSEQRLNNSSHCKEAVKMYLFKCCDASAASGCVSAHGVGMPAWWSTVGLHSSSTTVPSLQSAWVRRISSGQSFLKTEMNPEQMTLDWFLLSQQCSKGCGEREVPVFNF